MEVFVILFFLFVRADIPSNCSLEEVIGTWDVYVPLPTGDRYFNCSTYSIQDLINPRKNITLSLLEPNIVKGKYNNIDLVGNWTRMDVEGVEIYIDGLHYSLDWNYTYIEEDDSYVSNCSQTEVGWLRPDIVNPDDSQFYCIYAIKIDNNIQEEGKLPVTARIQNFKYPKNRKYIKNYKVEPVKSNRKRIEQGFPKRLDWTEYVESDGSIFSYASPVYNQLQCGSCYVFGALSMLEARFLIATNKTIDVSLSQQYITSCSPYSQGCYGGFGIEVGNYAKDHGIVSNKCFPYSIQNHKDPETNESIVVVPTCEKKCDITTVGTPGASQIFYAENVNYVGGYYGHCSEEAMLEALQTGPIAVSINSNVDAFTSPVDPTAIIATDESGPNDHLVLVVGYGEDPTNSSIKWWNVKNSWGPEWGNKGFIRVWRGNNTLNIESESELITPSFYGLNLHHSSSTSSKSSWTQREKILLVTVIVVGVLLVIILVILFLTCIIKQRSASPKDGSDYNKM